MSDKKNVIRISDPKRITRILEKANINHFPVLLRDLKDPKIAVKGECKGLGEVVQKTTGKRYKCVRISGVSQKGLDYIGNTKQVKLEFTMTSLKLVCAVHVIEKNELQRSIYLTPPQHIYSFERRTMVRHQIDKNFPVLVRLPDYFPTEHDLLAQPFFPHTAHLASNIGAADISSEGICLSSIFPSFLDAVQREKHIKGALIHLPMHLPIPVDMKYCWIKTIRKESPYKKAQGKTSKIYTVGCSFTEPSSDLIHAIHLFVKQVQDRRSI